MKRERKKVNGFTLIEVMVVVVILGILALIVVPNVIDHPDQARRLQLQQNIRAIESQLSLYRLNNFKYPTTEQGLQALVKKYMKRIPKDPWGNEYIYLNPGQYGEYDLYSLGADGANGGEGIDKDIGNWNLEDIRLGNKDDG